MGLQSFATFQALLKDKKHYPRKMGFPVKAGEINILNSRMRVARSFRGINLDGYSDKTDTKLGYDGLMQVFLTHAALERFCCAVDIVNKKGDPLVYSERVVTLTQRYGPERVVQNFAANDKGDRLFNFIHARLDQRLQQEFCACKEGGSCNVPAISAAIRHIFAHGHLTANANGLNIKRVHGICINVSDFILDFIDAEFTRRIDDYCTTVGFVQASSEPVAVVEVEREV